MKFDFVGPSYTAGSNSVADEECINFFAETLETPGAQTRRSYFGTPGLKVFTAFPDGPVRGSVWTGTTFYAVSGDQLYSVTADGTQTALGTIDNDGFPVSIAASNIQLLIVGSGKAFCYTFATNVLVEVTSQLAGTPIQCDYSDGYGVVCFLNSNKFQISAILDFSTWPGIQVNAVSVFPENIVSIIVSHRELWVFGSQHSQPYMDTGSLEIFDVIPGALIDNGSGATFGRNLVDNTIFWISEDQRGARQAWRANGYTPMRISNHAVETSLTAYPDISGLVSYSYQDGGHLFWVLYIPGTDCTWVYDVAESLWHKRAQWHPDSATYGPHQSWNHVYAFGKHLVGDWGSGNLWEMKQAFDAGGGNYQFVTENGNLIVRKRRAPTIVNEMEWIYHNDLTVDFGVGLGPQPPLLDGSGNPRPPQAMLRWSDNRGSTWSNQHIANCGLAGEYNTRVIWRRLGRSRYRVYEVTVSDPIPWAIVDAYLRTA
ncbi:hypothetical protein P8936_16510 [Edaphobacter paludis]|uniref:Bacteriophage P22, Gp10, DNA-stabilising n=1 Tax=Edaphobacter paludis TaxID=3035702 RepID=A0AAU7D7I9_9BACT